MNKKSIIKIHLLFIILVVSLEVSLAQSKQCIQNIDGIEVLNLTCIAESFNAGNLNQLDDALGLDFSGESFLEITATSGNLTNKGYTTYSVGRYLHSRSFDEDQENAIIENLMTELSAQSDDFVLAVSYLNEGDVLIDYRAEINWGDGTIESSLTDADRINIKDLCGTTMSTEKANNIGHHTSQARGWNKLLDYFDAVESGNLASDFEPTNPEDLNMETAVDEYRTYVSPAGKPLKLPIGTNVIFFENPQPSVAPGAVFKFVLPPTTDGPRSYIAYHDGEGVFTGYAPPGRKKDDPESDYYHNSGSAYSNGNEVEAYLGYLVTNGSCQSIVMDKVEVEVIDPNAKASGNILSSFDDIVEGICNSQKVPLTCYADIKAKAIENSQLLYYREIVNGQEHIALIYEVANVEGLREYVYMETGRIEGNGNVDLAPIESYFRWKGNHWEEFVPIAEKDYLDAAFDLIGQILTSSETGHLLLDVIGMIPFLGEAADMLNATWYSFEGRHAEAAISWVAATPFVGWAASGGKWVFKGAYQLSEKVAGIAIRQLDNGISQVKGVNIDAIKGWFDNLDNSNLYDENMIKILQNQMKASPRLMRKMGENPEMLRAFAVLVEAGATPSMLRNPDLLAKLADDLNVNSALAPFLKEKGISGVRAWELADEAIPGSSWCNF